VNDEGAVQTGQPLASPVAIPTRDEVIAALDDLQDVVYIADGDGRVRFVNAAVERMFGLGRAECLGVPMDALALKAGLAPDEVERLLHAYKAAARSRQPSIRYEARLATNGETRTFELLEHVLYGDEGECVAIRGVIRDVTERRALEDELRSSALLHSRTVRHSPIGIAVLDRELRFLAVSDQYLSDHCLAEANVVGRRFDEVFGEEANRWVNVFQRCLQGSTERSDEDTVVRAGGVAEYVRWECRPWSDSRDQIAGVILWIERITERKRLERRLVESQKLESLGRLAGGIAHDFNNLLTGILGYADLTQEAMEPDDPLRLNVEQIRRAAQRAADLTSQMLTFARREAAAPASVDVDGSLRALNPRLQGTLGPDIRLTLRLPPSLWQAGVDAGRLEQMVLQLAANARDAMPMGGELVIEASNAPIEDPSAARDAGVAPGRYVRIAVRDTGVGMPPDVLARAFEPFFTTKEVGKGTGLGLSTCHGIVHQAGGAISVRSQPGQGTEVQILLPQAAATALAPDFRILPGGGVAGTVLLVEDDELVRDVAVESLQAAGYRVLAARDAAQARALAASERGGIDLAIVDLVLPDASGIEAIAQIAGGRNLRVLYVSGRAEDDAPPGPLLAKPFTPRTLLQAVARALADG
jgi:two-component system cell cycle sensor histidine kinase/response regulator CckA